MTAPAWASPPAQETSCNTVSRRPGLVLEVEQLVEGGVGRIIVRVAYGTSQHVDRRYPGEFTVRAADTQAGLARDTKFDLGNSVRIPFDPDWFAVAPNRRYGEHPKRGILDLQDASIRRSLQAAIREAKRAGWL